MSRFIETLLKNGADGEIGGNLAPIIGLEKPMPMRHQGIVVSQHDTDREERRCFVVYENIESSAPEAKSDDKRAICAYIVKVKRAGLDNQVRYFRVDLDGKLEKVVMSQSKFDTAGNAIRGSGVKFDQDIDSPEVKKTFETEMKFWLKDWLKKEQKAAGKNSANAAASNSAATSL